MDESKNKTIKMINQNSDNNNTERIFFTDFITVLHNLSGKSCHYQ